MCNQGFSAEIPEAYLMTLQSSLQQADSPISYIGKADAIKGDHLLLTDSGAFRTRLNGYDAGSGLNVKVELQLREVYVCM